MTRESIEHSRWRQRARGLFPVNPALEQKSHPMILPRGASWSPTKHGAVVENVNYTSKKPCVEKGCTLQAVTEVDGRLLCASCALSRA